jgi:hypothetical protein
MKKGSWHDNPNDIRNQVPSVHGSYKSIIRTIFEIRCLACMNNLHAIECYINTTETAMLNNHRKKSILKGPFCA